MSGEQSESKTLGVFERPAAPKKSPAEMNSVIGFVADDPRTSRPDWPLTVPEIAERLRVGRRWVYEHADQLGAYRVGKYLRFDWDRVTQRLRSGALAAGKLGSQPNDPLKDE